MRALPGVERVLDEDGKRAAGARPSALGRAGCDRRARTAGSPTTTCSTRRARRTLPAPSISTASRATTRWSCSSIPSCACRSCASPRGWRAKQLGLRYLMDVIALDATLVKGSHGRPTDRYEDGPLFITSRARDCCRQGRSRPPTSSSIILDHVFAAATATTHGGRHDSRRAAAQLARRQLPLPTRRVAARRSRALLAGTPAIASCILPISLVIAQSGQGRLRARREADLSKRTRRRRVGSRAAGASDQAARVFCCCSARRRRRQQFAPGSSSSADRRRRRAGRVLSRLAALSRSASARCAQPRACAPT